MWAGRRESICVSLSTIYNIAFVNSEHRLAKCRVDITQCQHGKFPVFHTISRFSTCVDITVYQKENVLYVLIKTRARVVPAI